MLVAQGTVGVEGDFGAEQAGGRALELEHVKQVTIASNVAVEPAGGCEGEVGDAMPGSELDQLGGMRADLLLGGGWQVRRFGEWLAHAASLTVSTRPAAGHGYAPGSQRQASDTAGRSKSILYSKGVVEAADCRSVDRGEGHSEGQNAAGDSQPGPVSASRS